MTTTPTIELTVHEPGTRQTGQGVIRIPEQARRTLGVLSGDTVIIDSEPPLVTTVWPARGGLSPDSAVVDESIRRQTGISIGDVITVRAGIVSDATEISFVAEPPEYPDDLAQTIRLTLQHRPLKPGDQFSIDGHVIRVVETQPAGTVQLVETTTISFRSPARSPSDTELSLSSRYEDIGGLSDELATVRETVELPLTNPELFDDLGIDPPSGVLLHGPPGTGKTLIARAVATSVNATFYHISGPEITSKYKGESEERLRDIFTQAQESAPSIIFFDELDAIATKRDDGGDMENRVVAQLLSLMDGLDHRGRVIIVGATNRIDTIDPALRRPGRFDREIEIGVPREAGRLDILEIHTRDVPLAETVDLETIAGRTHGFVGADLKALVTEAAMHAIRRSQGTNDESRQIQVEQADFDAALAAITPSAMREFVAEIPATSFEDIGGLSGAKATLREAVEWPFTYPELFETAGTDPPSGLLLYGPPGTGKTLLARAIANETDVNFVHVAGPELLDKYVGESEQAVRDVFERARQAAPSIVFFDEIDAVAPKRSEDHAVTERVVSQLLTELDGLVDNPNVIVIAATNRKDAIDPAVLRPGRLEGHIEVPLPDLDARLAILEVHTRGMPLSESVDLSVLADELDGATGADIEALTRNAALVAIREFVTDRDPSARRPSDLVITSRHFQTAVAAMDASE